MNAYDLKNSGKGASINFEEIYQGYQGTVDYPGIGLWKEEMEFYPEAKIILHERDPDSWYESVKNTIYTVAYMGIPDEKVPKRVRDVCIHFLLKKG